MRYIIIFLFILIFFSAKETKAYNPDRLYILADSLFDAEEYLKASVLYERIIFNSKGDEKIKNNALLKKSSCYLQSGDPEKAAFILERAVLLEKSDSSNLEILYKNAFYYYLANDYNKALFKFREMPYYISDTNLIEPHIWLKIIILAELNEWDELKSLLSYYAKINNLHDGTDTLFTKAYLPKELNPQKAIRLSAILPAAGQFYARAPGSAIQSILLQSLSAAYTAYHIVNAYWVTAILTGTLTFLRFKIGDIIRAGELTKEFNKNENEKFKEVIYNIIIN